MCIFYRVISLVFERACPCMQVHVHVDGPLYGVRDTLTACTRHNHGEESAAFLPTPPHVHSVTIRSPARLSPTFARNFDLNLFKGCITRSRFSFLERSCLPARGARTLPCEPPRQSAAAVKFFRYPGDTLFLFLLLFLIPVCDFFRSFLFRETILARSKEPFIFGYRTVHV